MAADPNVQWECTGCTFLNDADRQVCVLCNTSKTVWADVDARPGVPPVIGAPLPAYDPHPPVYELQPPAYDHHPHPHPPQPQPQPQPYIPQPQPQPIQPPQPQPIAHHPPSLLEQQNRVHDSLPPSLGAIVRPVADPLPPAIHFQPINQPGFINPPVAPVVAPIPPPAEPGNDLVVADLQRQVLSLRRTMNIMNEEMTRLEREKKMREAEMQEQIAVLCSLLRRNGIEPPLAHRGVGQVVPPSLNDEKKEEKKQGGGGMSSLKQLATAASVIKNWTIYAEEKKGRRLTSIAMHAFSWIEKARTRLNRVNRPAEEGSFEEFLRNEEKVRELTEAERTYLFVSEHHQAQEYTCPVCFDNFRLEDLAILDDCHHFLCKECMAHTMTSNMDQGLAALMVCPVPECKRNLTEREARRLLSRRDYARYEELVFQDTLKKDSNCRWCPRRGCGTPMIGDPNHPMMRCPRPDCNFIFCFNCKEQWHADFTCAQYQQWKVENGEADARFEAWRREHTRPCPRCNVLIEKNGGCNHMTCTSCRYEYCHLCRGPYKSGHFSQEGPCNGKQFT
eukprot:TRINITY_DN691_c0_g2_i1.p1 TRINITY_DN691_c0_g2~~TRINITY_DN691_c0_g2_i1.p1  ORF type:complete len:561 (-),score=163.23 TRINITY_DN691_c0_g2_i1:174-1856(-)